MNQKNDYSEGAASAPLIVGFVGMGLPFASSWAMFQVSFGASVAITIIAAISWAAGTALVTEKLPWLYRWHMGMLVIGWCIALYFYLFVHPYPPQSAGKLPLGLMAPLAALVSLGFFAWVVPILWGVIELNIWAMVKRGEWTKEQAATARAESIAKLAGNPFQKQAASPAGAASGDEFAYAGGGDADFDFDASSFDGASVDETEDKLWAMAEDPRTSEAERQNAMKAIKRRNAKKRIAHKP